MVSTLAFPSIYLLTSHLAAEELTRLRTQIPSLEHDAKKADVILGKLSRKERAQFELRRLGIATEEIMDTSAKTTSVNKRNSSPSPQIPEKLVSAPKRQRTSGAAYSPTKVPVHSLPTLRGGTSAEPSTLPTVKVVKLAWFNSSIDCGKVLPLSDYILYEGRVAQLEPDPPERTTRSQPNAMPTTKPTLNRKPADAGEPGSASPKRNLPSLPTHSAHAQHNVFSRRTIARPRTLHRKSTSENDEKLELPPIPDCLHTIYSCQRSTPLHPPNEKFIDILKKIRNIRDLTGDKIGVRAYSSAIASLAAYPYIISTPTEVSRLPGCGPKIAELFREFSATGGHVHEVDDAETDPKLTALQLLCDIWGVAEATARSFYNRGWHDLDDVVEFGWAELTRVQQIGAKYYDELQEAMTRPQVEAIANTILEQADLIFPGFQMVIAGGYRRGKEMSGDVDVILSHPDEESTRLVIGRLVLALERLGRITHTLTFSTANSERAQEPVSWKGNAPRNTLVKSSDAGSTGGTGFDTLDKALVVWQEPAEKESGSGQQEPQMSKDKLETDGSMGTETEVNTGQAHGHKKPNPNPHRRVDIIVSPWKTVGCAVLGWSGGTTFQRDLRRYCKHVHGMRFDSSGVRSRVDGSWVDLEDFAQNPAPDMLTAERRVFTALGLEWRSPDERCTG